ncbi:four-helix bundle copper-binding protein [Lysobacter sp. UC]|uniref:Four-helix bundle copper-binding protein n=1 Tax=Lysobacter arvi TaxID=3038776 RepID=A0ABU1CA02_9GAMM|nr:four-helix bundle copper-binding protein [Lysobacter arvi]
MTHHEATHRSADMEECIRNCTECHAICVETIAYCARVGGKHAEAQHLSLLATCADICRTSADAMLRGSRVHGYVCGACAAVCSACADACSAMRDDPEMARCAEACRRCARSCEEMARGM